MQVSHGCKGLFHVAIKLHNGLQNGVITTERGHINVFLWL
jgi:hypothetical protein